MKTRATGIVPAALLSSAASLVAQPVITTQPLDQVAVPGQRVMLSVQATGAAPLRYQWQEDQVALPGRTNASLVFANIQVPDAGSYAVEVTDATGSVTSRVATLQVIGPVPLDPKLGVNIRLGDDPPQLPAHLRAQAEPHIARSFSDPNLLVATVQEGRYEAGGAAAGIGYSISRDGGLTWTRALLPGLTALTGGSFPRASDPVAAIDLEGRILLSAIGLPTGSPPKAILVSRAVGADSHFDAPTTVYENPPTGFVDKEWITINTFPTSPTAKRIAVLFGHLKDDSMDQLLLSYSDDHVQNWSPPQAVGSIMSYGCQPMFLPDGSLAVVYTRYLRPPTNWDLWETYNTTAQVQLEVIRAPEGGADFEPPLAITPLTGVMYHDPVARDCIEWVGACTDRQAGVIYVSYQMLVGPAANQAPRIMFTKSIDKGMTWSTPAAVNDTPEGRGVFNPCIAASPDGQHVTVAFYDKRHQTTNSANNLVDYYLAESFDGGDTWEPNIRLSEVSTDLRLAPLSPGSLGGRMLADYQGIVPALNFDSPGVAVWIDTRAGNPDPYSVRIARTRGTTFETWRRLRFSTKDLPDAVVSGETADPDGDGIPNLAEYAFGLEANHADPGPLKIGYDRRFLGWNVSYERLAVLSDILVTWQTSTNLVDWIPWVPDLDDGSVSVSQADPSREIVRVAITRIAEARFYRLSVSLINPAS